MAAVTESHTVENLVFNRVFPVGGIKDLKQAVLTKINEFDKVAADLSKASWTPSFLRRYVS